MCKVPARVAEDLFAIRAATNFLAGYKLDVATKLLFKLLVHTLLAEDVAVESKQAAHDRERPF
jgi:uncharacterized UPF0146 family protein